VRHDDLGRSVERTTRRVQQLGGGEAAQRPAAVEEQVRGARADLQSDLDVGPDEDPGEQAAEAWTPQDLGRAEPGGDGVGSAEGLAQIDEHGLH
jgi:hypothetical protein